MGKLSYTGFLYKEKRNSGLKKREVIEMIEQIEPEDEKFLKQLYIIIEKHLKKNSEKEISNT